ncbi:MAG: sirohydrochlorin chelatase [Myxococcota bacterium]
MRALILVAHGSRRRESNEAIRALGARVAEVARPRFDHVTYAFLELAEPFLRDAIDRAVRSGCREITLVPCLLAPGRHVVEQLPEIVRDAQQINPEVAIHLTEILGDAEELPSWIVEVAVRSTPGERRPRARTETDR